MPPGGLFGIIHYARRSSDGVLVTVLKHGNKQQFKCHNTVTLDRANTVPTLLAHA